MGVCSSEFPKPNPNSRLISPSLSAELAVACGADGDDHHFARPNQETNSNQVYQVICGSPQLRQRTIKMLQPLGYTEPND